MEELVLGRNVDIPTSPKDAVIQVVPNTNSGQQYVVRFTCPEFSSICPITKQPDFAHFVIDYVPDRNIIESKSLKLFLNSFRNHGAFHEDCTMTIAGRLITAADPIWLRIAGYWYPRGGIPIDIFYQTNIPPYGIWVPDPGVSPYRGRG